MNKICIVTNFMSHQNVFFMFSFTVFSMAAFYGLLNRQKLLKIKEHDLKVSILDNI